MKTNRRSFLKGSAAAGAAALFASPALGQGTQKITFSLSGPPSGQSAYLNVAQAKGYWSKRGLDVDVIRSAGSGAVTTAVGSGSVDFGLVQLPIIMISKMGGLPIVCVSIGQYDSMLGVGYLTDGPIKVPKDLEGKTLNYVPAGGIAPLLPLFAEKTGFDASKVRLNSVDLTITEQLMMQRKVDGLLGAAYTSLPPCITQGFDAKFMLYGKAGIQLYGTSMVASQNTYETKKDLCQRVIDGALEGMADALRSPDEALDIFIKSYPEIALTKTGRQYAQLGLGMTLVSIIDDEPIANGLGHVDFAKLEPMTDLVVKYVAKPGSVRPDPKTLFTNDFAGRVKLTPAEWELARKNAQPYTKYIA